MPESIAQETKTPEKVELKRTLGTTSIVFMVVAAAAPLSVAAGAFPLILLLGNGIGAPADYLIAGAVLVLFSIGFTTMSHHIFNAGAFYAYIQKGLGRVSGLASAVLAIISYIALQVGVFAYFGEATKNMIMNFTGVEIPWWLFAMVGIALVAFLGHHNVEMSAKVLSAALVAEVAVVLVVDFSILAAGGEGGLRPDSFLPENVFSPGIGIGIMLAIFGFIGFEATAAFRAEARNPQRTIPRATYIAVTLITLFYVLWAWLAIIGLGVDDAVKKATDDPEGLVHGLAAQYAGTVVHDIMQVLLATSFFACVLTFHNVICRYLFTMGNAGVIDPRISRIHPKHSSPFIASALVAATTAFLVAAFAIPGLDPVVHIYTWMSGASTLGVIALMTTTSIAVLVFFHRNPQFKYSAWRTKIAPALAAAALFISMVLLIMNFELLMGSLVLAIIFIGVMLAAVAFGVWWALRLRSRHRKVYDALLAEEQTTA